MTFSDCLVGGPTMMSAGADGREEASCVRALEIKAEKLRGLGRLRMRHLATRVMADHVMNLMLTLVIAECQGLSASEQSVTLTNNLAPLEGAALIDDLVQAGLAVATGKMPGKRTVGLTPLGSARMRAYLSGFPEI